MFERYNESARRSIFFARHEACHRGSGEITPADIALGVAREAKHHERTFAPLTGRWEELVTLLAAGPARAEVEDSDVPLSDSGKRVLAYANEESQRDGGGSIEPEHLLRGVLREGDAAAKKLGAVGLDLRTLREASAAGGRKRSRFGSRGRSIHSLRWWLIGATLAALGAVFYLHSQQ